MTRASDIAGYLGTDLTGMDLEIISLRAAAAVQAGALVFLARHDENAMAQLNGVKQALCITTPELAESLECTVLEHALPRLAFCQVAERFFPSSAPDGIHPTAVVADSAHLEAQVSVGPGCVVGDSVRIGRGTVLGANVVVAPNVSIGRGCLVKSNTTIGERGFGFARDERQVPVSFPHIGSVEIGDHVEIGANCTVVCAALDVTRIGDHVKTDDQVHIAHNTHIGARTLIAAGVVVSGSARVGCEVWIGPNATLSDYVEVGDGAHIGLGSVVRKRVAPGCTVFGNPARVIKKGRGGQ